MDRHGRQTKLAEVGVDGQARIAQAVVAVGVDGLAADVAVRYLAGAGVFGLRVREAVQAQSARAIAADVRIEVDPDLTLDSESGSFDLLDPSAQEVASGAHAALRALRAILDRRS